MTIGALTFFAAATIASMSRTMIFIIGAPGIRDLGLFVQLALDVAELRQLEVEAALERRHRDAQRRARRIGENLRPGALERAHLAAHAEHGLIERERLVDVVGRMDGVHQADDAGLVRRIGRRRLGREDGVGKQAGRGYRAEDSHEASPVVVISPFLRYERKEPARVVDLDGVQRRLAHAGRLELLHEP